MLRFGVRRALALALTLFFMALAVFVLLTVIPGDAARLVVGPEASEEAYQAARAALGLDEPWPSRFAHWLARALRGDFGNSRAFQERSVRDLLGQALTVTVPLALWAAILAALMGLVVGVGAAVRPGGWLDLLLMGLAQWGAAIPEFWLGVLLVGALAVTLRLFPSGGFPGWESPKALVHLVLPGLALALPRGAYLARMVRGSMVDVLSMRFVDTARAKGASEARVYVRHALRNALIPLVAAFGLVFARLLAGALVIEYVFSLPGMGMYALRAMEGRDLPLLLGLAVVAGGLAVTVSTLADVGFVLLDPRIRYR